MTVTISLLWWQTFLLVNVILVTLCIISGLKEKDMMGMAIIFYGSIWVTILVWICGFFYWLGMS